MRFQEFSRQSLFGRVVYHLSSHKRFGYKEEEPGYIIPEKYLVDKSSSEKTEGIISEENNAFIGEAVEGSCASDSIIGDVSSKVLVDWDGADDIENPYNWPIGYKVFLMSQIAILTTSVYMGASIYTPGIAEIRETFGVSQTVASLPLALFVIGYGIGPMIWSPFSENAVFGRTNIYLGTLFIFLILQIPTALVKNIAGLSILRLVAGFFASPCLATGGASFHDVLSHAYAPVGVAAWSMACVCGPSFGPLIGSALTVAGGWRWTFWFLAISSGVCLISLTFFLPETYGKTILLRRAQRLRGITGNQNITTQDEIDNASMSIRNVAIETLYRPLEISIIEPVVLLINLYIALVYSVIYLWFEAFPIVFLKTYHFTLVQLGCAYLSTVIGIAICCTGYIIALKKVYTQKVMNNEEVYPEVFIPIAIVGSIFMPVGIFMFSFTANTSVHWIAPMIGAAIFSGGAFLIFQSLLNYLGMSFWRYVASVFAGNALFRSVVAGVFPLFGESMYNNLATSKYPVGWGSAILGFISLIAIAIPVLFYKNGPKLRARSKYAGAA